MNREIKFRAWVVDEYQEDGNTPKTFKMVQWFPEFFSDTSPVTHYGSEIMPEPHTTLMQFTGLKDKNGTEIYEGDIIRQNGPDSAIRFIEYRWSNFLATRPSKTETILLSYIYKTVEVIGNIYENLDLMQG